MLKVNGVHKSYQSGTKKLDVLKGIDLAIEPGTFVALVGPSGAGKSTLLHIIGGLDAPDRGSVLFEEKDLYRLKDSELARLRSEDIGFVFQFYHLLSEFTVLENVLMPGLIRGREKADGVRQRALELLERVGLGERTGHFPAQLSGGEKQRCALVRALINNPRLLLCDEPTGNLDSATSDEIIALIQRIHRENKMTILIVTHNQDVAKRAHNAYQMRDGILIR
ncbi:MAG: ABC transporter ATP-binding protein [Candidatus Omnitrophica bacterium]|nr:ABC transporter ATP-binding protein [Candidatus Omnitrophota bacterium]